MRTLNLGILAHVDAGKTTLTERLLYAAGAIDAIGSVDAGTTRTDTLALERDRGITIRSAVASFAIGDVTVNLIDTPGHPDFIAEVERVLGVLDGVVLVVSAVEGVQPQTRVLMRTLCRLRIPTLIFVNKIDRTGADDRRVLRAIGEKLSPSFVPMGSAYRLGDSAAGFTPYAPDDAGFRSHLLDLLSAYDDGLLATYLDDEAAVTGHRLCEALCDQVRNTRVHPVFFGSAITGAGVEALMTGIAELLPAGDGDADAPASGTVFKIERGTAGEKVVYVRMFAGTVRVRDRLPLGSDRDGKVTAIGVAGPGAISRSASVSAGQIGVLHGLGDARVGDAVGEPPRGASAAGHFAPPTLETVVVPDRRRDRGALHIALTQLAEQDPLINMRHDERRSEISVSLYGEVQKEVVQATLATEYGIGVGFRESTTICVERPIRTGEAVEILNTPDNPFRATIGLRIDPGPPGSGIEFRLDVPSRAVPMYFSKTVGNFAAMMSAYVRRTLDEGLYGWQVIDCAVTMVECTYSSTDGPPSTRGPLSTAADFRDLTPLVVMRALQAAGTRVCEPMHRFHLELPVDTLGVVLPVLSRLHADLDAPVVRGSSYALEGDIPAARVHALRQRLPALTGGEGVMESGFDHYRPVRGEASYRPRIDPNPLDRQAYLHHLQHRA